MTESGLAVRYARALYETARESSSLKEAAADISALAGIFSQVEGVREYCLRGDNGRNEGIEFCRIAFAPYVSELAERLLEAAVRNGRIAILPLLPDAFQQVADREEGITPVLVDTAFDPGNDLAERLDPLFETLAGRSVRVEYRHRPEILGGVRILMNSKLIDMSTAHRLQEMRRWLKQDRV